MRKAGGHQWRAHLGVHVWSEVGWDEVGRGGGGGGAGAGAGIREGAWPGTYTPSSNLRVTELCGELPNLGQGGQRQSRFHMETRTGAGWGGGRAHVSSRVVRVVVLVGCCGWGGHHTPGLPPTQGRLPTHLGRVRGGVLPEHSGVRRGGSGKYGGGGGGGWVGS
jgi:hypothetical protein